MRKSHKPSQNRQKTPRQNSSRPPQKGHERPRPVDSRPDPRPEKRLQPARSRLSVKSDQVMIYGLHPAAAALSNPARVIKAIYVTGDASTWINDVFTDQLTRRQLTPIIIDRSEMTDALPPQDKHVHQGVVLVAKPLSPPLLEDWLDQTIPAQEDDHISHQLVVVMLDQITDGRNIGAIMRSALAFGVGAIIATDRNTPTETGAMLRAASGASERMPLIRVVNLSRAITLLQDSGFTVAGLDARGADDLSQLEHENRLALVLGAEGSGLRHLTREKVDHLVRIPMSDHAESLNVSNAAAVALYAATARHFKTKKND